MMWAMRRQLSGVVKYCWPASCCPAATSHSRNSALSRPSLCRVIRPIASACALIVRQSGKRGTASTLVIFSRKAAGSSGANRPQRLRLLVMIWQTPWAASLSAGVPPRKSGIAIGIGCTLPCVMSTVTAWAGNEAIARPAAAALPRTSAWRRLKPPPTCRAVLATHGSRLLRSFTAFTRIAGAARNKLRRSTTENLAGIKVDIDFLPLIVGGQGKHVVGLRLEHGAHGAVAGRRVQWTVAIAQDFRLTDQAVIARKPDAYGDDILIGMRAHGRRRIPQRDQFGPQRIKLALRQMRGLADGSAQRSDAVKRVR